jgi:hypothetical protein
MIPIVRKTTARKIRSTPESTIVMETVVDESTVEKKIVVTVPGVTMERSPRSSDAVRNTIGKITSLDNTVQVAVMTTSHGTAGTGTV